MSAPAVGFRLLKVGQCSHPECVATRGGRWRNVPFPALCGLIEHPTRGFMLFDTGYSEHFFTATAMLPERFYRWITPVSFAPADALPAQLRRLGIDPADIGHVLISHFHGDHVAGLKDFPNARFIAMRADYDALRQASRLGNLLKGRLLQLLPGDFHGRLGFAEDAPLAPLPSEFHPFEQGFDLFGDASMLAVPLPGHSRGQMGLAFRSADGRMVFLVADACWSSAALARGAPATWLAGRIFDHPGQYLQTFAKLRALAAAPHAPALVPSHCEQAWNELRHDRS